MPNKLVLSPESPKRNMFSKRPAVIAGKVTTL